MSDITNSGIRTAKDGTSYIPASKRNDGTTRKEIKVRPGWTPQEDVQTYKSRNAEAWKSRGSGGIPGADNDTRATKPGDLKSKNAKRREAAKKNKEAGNDLDENANETSIGKDTDMVEQSGAGTAMNETQDAEVEAEAEKQKKIRNQLKRLKAVQDLKLKKAGGEKLSPDQLVKLSKESELFRDLKKLGYDGPELVAGV